MQIIEYFQVGLVIFLFVFITVLSALAIVWGFIVFESLIVEWWKDPQYQPREFAPLYVYVLSFTLAVMGFIALSIVVGYIAIELSG